MRGQKTGGRVKGQPNRLTTEMREKLKAIVDNELQNLDVTLMRLSEKDRLEIIVKLLPFILPKMTEVNIQQEEGKAKIEPIVVTIITDKDAVPNK